MSELEDVNFERGNLEKRIEEEKKNNKPSPETRRIKWSGFVESSVLDFFNEYKMERMTIEDGDGNKAKISRSKEYEIKVEYSSVVML